LQTLNPIQQAHIIINYEPIIPNLPQIFKQMLPDDLLPVGFEPQAVDFFKFDF
jgi:hypothetical protein